MASCRRSRASRSSRSRADPDMRILHLWDNYAPGLFDQSFDICRGEGIETALATMNLVVGADERIPSGVRFVRRKAKTDDPQTWFGRFQRRARERIDAGRFLRVVENSIKDFRPDALHIHFGTTAALLAGSDSLNLPFVVSFYGFDISQALTNPRTRAAYGAVMSHDPLVHILCAEAAERAAAMGARPDRIVDANLPLPLDRYPNVGVQQSSISRWLIPARFVAKKGHEVLLEAFRRHLVDHPDHRLTCWGYGDGDKLRDRVERLGLSDRVSVINNEHEGPFDAAYLAQLRDHDVILAPSVRSPRGDDEGGPALTAVLAQVAGKPVIVSDFPGSERSVSDEVEGLVVPQGDPASLARAMARLTADPALAKRMGQAGRARALRDFSRDAYASALVGWYDRLTS